MQHYDLIIIGTGAGGGTLARKLAPTGKKILILERGDFLPKERENWDPIEVFAKGRYRTQESWYDGEGKPFSPFTHYWVGGNTKLYGAALLRLRESDFTNVQHFDGVSPAWPLSYADFEPYYQQAETLYKVHGATGFDPCEPPRSQPYPYPALEHEPRMKQLFEDLQKMGHKPAPLAVAVNPGDDKPFPQAPVNLSNFDGFPDLTEAKQDAHVVGINYALGFDNVTLKTNTYVERLETDTTGKQVTQVVAKHGEEEIRYQGDIVVVSCGAVNSAALMLRSANDQHPNGLANSSDQVGRNYMLHNNGTLVAISEEPNPSVFQKSLMITEFYHGAPDSEFPLGSVQMMGKTDPDSLAQELKDHPEILDVLPNATVEEISAHSIDFFLTAEDLPLAKNRVTVRKDGSIQTHYTQNNMEAYRRLREKMIGMMEGIGCKACAHRDNAYVGYKLGISGVSHQNGTLRFGTDPTSSVLDVNCKAHDLDNLYVVDTSFFPSAGAVNPSLTAMANALRVGDHLIDRMR